MKIICSGIKFDGRKRTSVLVALALLNCFNQAFAITYDELNGQRAAVGLPLLTGNNQVDFKMLLEECNEGIEYSCFLAQQLQRASKQQQNSPAPIPFDLNNQLEGLPELNAPQHRGNADVDGALPQQFDLRDPLEGLPLLGTKAQQCAQLAGRINSFTSRKSDLERWAELAQREMYDVCRGKSQVNCGMATGKASAAAQTSNQDGAFYAQKISELTNLYIQMGCGQ